MLCWKLILLCVCAQNASAFKSRFARDTNSVKRKPQRAVPDDPINTDGNPNFGYSSSSSSVSVSTNGEGETLRVSQTCYNGVCQACVNDRCWENVSFSAINAEANCPVAACESSCTGFKIFTDNCPICECSGYATREPCDDDNECVSAGSGTCENHLCRYSVDTSDLVPICDYTYQCPADQACVRSRCGPSERKHSANQSAPCFWANDCGSGYYCERSTCYEGSPRQSVGKSCFWDDECPSGSYCDWFTGTCFDSGVANKERNSGFGNEDWANK